MRTDGTRSESLLRRRCQFRRLWGLVAAVGIVLTSGCQAIVRTAVGALIGEEAPETRGLPRAPPLPPPRQLTLPQAPRSDFLWGPVIGWEYFALRVNPYQLPTALFQVDLFAGACPGLYVVSDQPDSPFGAQTTTLHFQFLDIAPSHAADVNYYRFGAVAPTGMADPFPPGAFTRMRAMAGGACTSVGIPILSLGSPYRHMELR